MGGRFGSRRSSSRYKSGDAVRRRCGSLPSSARIGQPPLAGAAPPLRSAAGRLLAAFLLAARPASSRRRRSSSPSPAQLFLFTARWAKTNSGGSTRPPRNEVAGLATTRERKVSGEKLLEFFIL
ncbi:unnamed protein product [Urochloa humidicola]